MRRVSISTTRLSLIELSGALGGVVHDGIGCPPKLIADVSVTGLQFLCSWTPRQSFLLPPSPLEWLPENHLAYFVLDVVDEVELSAIEISIQSKDRTRLE